MSSVLKIVLAVVGTGVALVAPIIARSAAHRREVTDLRQYLHRELSGIRERLARLEGVIDIFRFGMQLPRTVSAEQPETAA